MQPEPILDVAHLGHVELLTDKPEESLDFFRRRVSGSDRERARRRQCLSAGLGTTTNSTP